MLRKCKRGKYVVAHLYPTKPVVEAVEHLGLKVLVIVRDPHDTVVSLVDYILRHHTHRLRDYFVTLPGDEDRVITVINGLSMTHIDSRLYLEPLRQRLLMFLPWLNHSQALVVKFEALVGSQGGGSSDLQYQIIRRVAQHVGVSVNEARIRYIQNRLFGHSSTFNKGQIGRWRGRFSDRCRAVFDESVGDLLPKYGYDSDSDKEKEIIA